MPGGAGILPGMTAPQLPPAPVHAGPVHAAPVRAAQSLLRIPSVWPSIRPCAGWFAPRREPVSLLLAPRRGPPSPVGLNVLRSHSTRARIRLMSGVGPDRDVHPLIGAPRPLEWTG